MKAEHTINVRAPGGAELSITWESDNAEPPAWVREQLDRFYARHPQSFGPPSGFVPGRGGSPTGVALDEVSGAQVPVRCDRCGAVGGAHHPECPE